MTDLQQQLEKCIQKAALDGALTEDAVKQFHGIVEANAKLVKENDHQNILIVEKNAAITELQEKLSKFIQKEGAIVERQHEVAEREQHMTKLEQEAKHQCDRVEDHKNMMELIFRNSIIRREVMTPVAGLKADQYGTSHSPYAHKESVEEKEE